MPAEVSTGAGLEIDDLHVRYGRVHAVRGVSLKVAPGEIVAVLGANGAGKSSLLKTLIGLEPAAGGRVTYGGADITQWRPSQRIAHRLVLVPEGYHPVVAAHGYNVYYLNALAGSARSLAASDDPDYAWVRSTWHELDPRVPVVKR